MNCDELFEFEITMDGYRLKSYLRKDDPSVTDIEIPAKYMGKKVWLIMPRAFENARYIRSVHIPKKLSALATMAFAGCTALERVRISSKKLTMLSGVFDGCTSLKRIVLPEKTYSITTECFKGCTALEDVTVLGGIWKISYDAFEDCVSLKKITLPESLEKIEHNAFANCPSLESLTLKSSVIEAEDGGGLFGCPKLSAETLLPLAINVRETVDDEKARTVINWKIILSRADVFALVLRRFDERPAPELVVGRGDIALLSAAAENGMFTVENIDALVEYSASSGSTEVTAWLLEYKNSEFGFDGVGKYEL